MKAAPPSVSRFAFLPCLLYGLRFFGLRTAGAMSSGETSDGILVRSSTFGSRGRCEGGMSAGSISIRFGPSRMGPPAGAGVWFVFGILFLLAAGRVLRRGRLWVGPGAAAEADGASPACGTCAGTAGAAAQATRAAHISSLIRASSRDGPSPSNRKLRARRESGTRPPAKSICRRRPPRNTRRERPPDSTDSSEFHFVGRGERPRRFRLDTAWETKVLCAYFPRLTAGLFQSYLLNVTRATAFRPRVSCPGAGLSDGRPTHFHLLPAIVLAGENASPRPAGHAAAPTRGRAPASLSSFPKEISSMKSFRRWAFVAAMVAALCVLVWNGPRPASGQNGGAGKKSEIDDARSRSDKGAKKMLDESIKGGKAEDSILEPEAEQEEEGEGEDPDLPPWMAGKIDKAAYLRLRADYVDLRRGRPHNLPFNPRERALEKMKKQENEKKARRLLDARFGVAAAALADPEWRSLGPKPIPNGQTSAGSVPVSGRTISIAVHPTDPNTVYVGTAQGGLYKSTNGGANWTALFDFELETLAIGAITIDPVDSNIVYVGTGEPNQSADSFAGRGLYIIRNANSATPVLTGPFRLNGAGQDVFTGRSFGRIMVNPLDHNVVFVSTTSGTGGNPNTA